MLEIVYFRKYKKKGRKIFNRLIYRSLLCYLALIGLAITYTIINQDSFRKLLEKSLLLSETLYGTIFALYTFLLIITIPVLWVRKRFGLYFSLILILAIWIIDFSLISNSVSLPKPFSLLGGIVLGLGGEFGPSFFHSLSLALAGMIVGNFLYSKNRRPYSGLVCLGLSLVCISLTLYEIIHVGVDTFMQNIENISVYRQNNSIFYYSYGFCASLIMISIAYGLSKILPTTISRFTEKVGGNTLSYFFLSNVILIMTYDTTLPSPFFAVVIILVYLSFFGYITIWWAKYGQQNRLVLSLENKINALIDFLIPNSPTVEVVPAKVVAGTMGKADKRNLPNQGVNKVKERKEMKSGIH